MVLLFPSSSFIPYWENNGVASTGRISSALATRRSTAPPGLSAIQNFRWLATSRPYELFEDKAARSRSVLPNKQFMRSGSALLPENRSPKDSLLRRTPLQVISTILRATLVSIEKNKRPEGEHSLSGL